MHFCEDRAVWYALAKPEKPVERVCFKRLSLYKQMVRGCMSFTDQIAQWVQGNGLVNLFVQHSSASLLIQENADRDVRSDLTAFFDRLVPPATHPSMSYLTHLYEGADDMPAHIKAALLPTFLTIPLHEGQLALGTWQGIYLVEHRAAPHQRRVFASVLRDQLPVHL